MVLLYEVKFCSSFFFSLYKCWLICVICYSLAVRCRSSVGRDNLKSFYIKIKLNTKPKDHHEDATSKLSQFVELFLHMHRTVMFSQKGSEEFAAMMPLSNELGTTLSSIIQSEQNEEPSLSKATTSLLHIVRTTLTRIVTILMISIWIAGERLKDNEEHALRPVIMASQIHMFTFTFHLLSGVYRSSRQALELVRPSLNAEKYEKLESMLDEALLPGLSIWASYLSTNTTAIAQYCTTASNDVRNREPEKKDLAKVKKKIYNICGIYIINLTHLFFFFVVNSIVAINYHQPPFVPRPCS